MPRLRPILLSLIACVWASSTLSAAAVIPSTAASSTLSVPETAQPQAKDEAPLQLLMVERVGCIYCEAWRREVMPEYAATPEGKTAPLLRVDLNGVWPDGIALARKPFITPTFVLLQDGKEVSRLEGYPGEMYFWPMLDNMITKAGFSLPTTGG